MMTDNESAIADVKTWIGTQVGDYRNSFRNHLDGKHCQTVDELRQEAETYIKNNPLIFTAYREESKDEIEQWKDVLEDKIAIHGENIASSLEEDLHTKILEDMSAEELDGLISYSIGFFNTLPTESMLLDLNGLAKC